MALVPDDVILYPAHDIEGAPIVTPTMTKGDLVDLLAAVEGALDGSLEGTPSMGWGIPTIAYDVNERMVMHVL